jgi:hypothetical protein
MGRPTGGKNHTTGEKIIPQHFFFQSNFVSIFALLWVWSCMCFDFILCVLVCGVGWANMSNNQNVYNCAVGKKNKKLWFRIKKLGHHSCKL